MPDLESDISAVENSEYYFDADVIRCFGQLPRLENSQDLHNYHEVGYVDADEGAHGGERLSGILPANYEGDHGPNIVQEVLVWLDDVLGFAETPEDLINVLEAIINHCEQ
ncbi:hypothetical protein F441_11088 [Phytophthora nicotianae CJ01A1]|nr:hypothetical protein L915_10887 [Phytophthora nicotianae]ETL90669.1 hypothetical protein L917_10690 [Phytophthora nicotianae]ETM43970.1 hypothetical protein L914_10730 [Phytophthora nicotianae]ETO72755.1 hypothetical protein F444_11235 [Phytophthora nicotianae P1976]ETP13895.1 hypothetical protein F441_11088 [Phytophthora nicotianae CJ01A1]